MRQATLLRFATSLSTILFYATIAAAQGGCKDYYSKGNRAPALETVSDTITISDGFPLGDVSVTLDLSHRRIGALVVSLTAQPPAWATANVASRRVILKERGLGRLGDNMYMTSFSDASQDPFPVAAEASPFRGVFKPTQRLSFLYDDATPDKIVAGAGGSQGDWVLRIDDVAPNTTIRPIALNGWMIRLCPKASVPVPPVTVPSPAPQPENPITSFEGPTPSPTPTPTPTPSPAPVPSPLIRNVLGGWKVVLNPAGSPPIDPAAAEQVVAFEGTGETQLGSGSSSTLPPVTVPQGSLFTGFNSADPFGIKTFQTSFNSYLLGRFGNACTDPTCANIKAKFWKAALGMAYMKARFSGRLDSSELINKLAELIPGENPLLGKLSDAAANWESKSTDLLRGLSLWYDKIQQHMMGNTAGFEALLSGALSGGEGLKALGIDPATAASALGPLLGLDNADDARALMDGLNDSGFKELLDEFLDTSSFSFRR